MTREQTKDLKQQQQPKEKKEKEQDIKNAEFLAKMEQPNHPNT